MSPNNTHLIDRSGPEIEEAILDFTLRFRAHLVGEWRGDLAGRHHHLEGAGWDGADLWYLLLHHGRRAGCLQIHASAGVLGPGRGGGEVRLTLTSFVLFIFNFTQFGTLYLY